MGDGHLVVVTLKKVQPHNVITWWKTVLQVTQTIQHRGRECFLNGNLGVAGRPGD